MKPDEYINASFEDKLAHSQDVIAEWYTHWKGQVYVAFSGGKDSTVLLHSVRSMYPEVKAVFSNTGLEYPEIVNFAKLFDNVEIVRPKKNFRQVLMTDGFPIISKKVAEQVTKLQKPTEKNFNSRRLSLTGYATKFNNFNKGSKIPTKWFPIAFGDVKVTGACCNHLKKNPLAQYQKDNPGMHPYVGMMMGEGNTRDGKLKTRMCNVFDSSNPTSVPLKFWNDKDVYRYIKEKDIKICSVYEDFDLKRTGCTFCAYGAHLEDQSDNRFVKLKKSHPKQFEYFVHKLGMNKALDYAGVNYGETPIYVKPDMPTYYCKNCMTESPMDKIGFITQRQLVKGELDRKLPTMGMNLYCRNCAIKLGLPVES